MTPIPETMLSARQHSVGADLLIETVPVPIPGTGEVLIKILSAPINPSDLSFLQGTYAEKPNYPVTPGIEACGVVVAKGKGLLPSLRMGKRVACSSGGKGGTWAEYMVTSADKCIPVPADIDNEQASMLIVNPLTALAFVDISKTGNHRAIVQTAAAGALGRMMVQLCKQENIPLINIVRSQKNAEQLTAIGAENIICMAETGYMNKLSAQAQALNATLALDCIGGETTKLLTECMPVNSSILVYAKLSESDSIFDTRTVVQKHLTIQGFFLANWTRRQNILKMLKTIGKAKTLLAGNNTVQIQQTVSLSSINEGIALYRNNMGAGKVICIFE